MPPYQRCHQDLSNAFCGLVGDSSSPDEPRQNYDCSHNAGFCPVGADQIYKQGRRVAYQAPDLFAKQTCEYVFVQIRQGIQIIATYAFVNFMDGRVDRPEFHNLGTGRRNEATIGCTAGG